MADEKRGPGQPKLDLDMDLMCNLAKIQCTLEEIAEIMGCDRQTIRNHMGDLYERSKQEGRSSLRRKQYMVAMEGNPTMLVWLGKNWLGQTDQVKEEKDSMILPWEDDAEDE